MTTFSIPNRPVGTQTRSISAILANFDAIIDDLNGAGVDTANLADYAVTPAKLGVMAPVQVTREGAIQSVATGVGYVPIDLTDTEVYDPSGLHDPVTNPSRVTVAVSGVYLVIARIRVTSSGSWDGAIRRNGTTIETCPGQNGSITIAAMVSCAAGQYIEAAVNNATGGSINATAALTVCFVSK